MAPKQKPGTSKQDYGTPPEFVTAACRMIGIGSFAWDLAATRGENNIAPDCFTKEDDALRADLLWPVVGWNWLNPEYTDIAPWVQKAYEQKALGSSTAVLIPASIGANWWVQWVEDKATIVPLHGRITFVGHVDAYPKDCALLLYSPTLAPGYVKSWKWLETLTEEEREMAKRRIGKPTKVKEPKRPKVQSMAPRLAAGRKKKRTPPPEEANDTTPREMPSPGRVTTFKPNGGSSMAIAPDPAPLNLGAIVLPAPDDAVKVLGELAELNDRALQAKKIHDDLKERTKAAKEKYDDLAGQVLTKLQQSTHNSGLPLFADVEQREQDQTAMETAPDLPEPPDAPADAPAATENDAAPDGAAMPLPVPEPAGVALADEEIPF